MILDTSILRMRRFLRDPSGLIWTDTDLINYFNDASTEIAQKSGLLERLSAMPYPPCYTWAYMFDWEFQYTVGDRWQCLAINQLTGDTICYPWEPAYFSDACPTADDGYRSIFPFEGALSGSPAEPIEMQLDSAFIGMRFAAYDQWPIMPLTRREVIDNDRWYKTRVGSRVSWYYRPEEYGNKLVLYPAPAGIIWQDDALLASLDDSGGLVIPQLSDTDTGVTISTVDLAGALFCIYDAVPYRLESVADEIYWPDWFVKYVEYGTLERAFAADTDGYIPTLRDYWKLRKDAGIKILERVARMRVFDQDYRMGGPLNIPRSKGGSLPYGYPPTSR